MGSAVLGDWREEVSDIDLLLLSADPVPDAIRRMWRRAARLGAARSDLIIADPADLVRAGDELNLAVALTTAERCGHRLRGGPAPTLAPEALARTLDANLETYWRPWIEAARGPPIGGPAWAMFGAFGAVWLLSGLARIRSTLVDGHIVSKREALNLSLSRLPEHLEILDEAGRLRDGAAPRIGPLQRRRRALDCADDLLARRW